MCVMMCHERVNVQETNMEKDIGYYPCYSTERITRCMNANWASSLSIGMHMTSTKGRIALTFQMYTKV